MEPGAGNRPEFLPHLQLDDLLAELQMQLQVVMANRDQMRGLIEAVVAIGSGLDLESTLRRIVQTAVGLVDATYGALGVIGEGKRRDFTEDDEAVLAAPGAAAAVAVENARLYEAARRQQRWIQASAEVTTRLLSGSAPGEVLAGITRQARELSGADLAVLALPDEEGRRLMITYAEGDGADAARGLVLPVGQSLSGRVLATGEPLTAADFAADERASQAARGAMAHIGPAVVFPLGAPGNVRGVLTVGRRHGGLPFPQAQADAVASFAAQAGVALELAASTRKPKGSSRGDIVALVEEMTPMLGFAPSLRLGPGLAAPVSGEVAEQALAALREALSNAARHASASEVDVTVDVDPDGILAVQVIDDGTGIPAGTKRSGLRDLTSRAEKLGGELRLEPADATALTPGTKLEWRVPRG